MAMEKPLEKDADWWAVFKLAQDASNEVLVIDAETREPLPGGVAGSALQAVLAVPAEESEDDIPQQSLMIKYVPQGELDPDNFIPMQIRLIKPSDAIYLMFSIAHGLLEHETYQKMLQLVLDELDESEGSD